MSTEIPDILTPPQCAMLQKWDGDLKFLHNFKFRRFGVKHLEQAITKHDKNERKKMASSAVAKNDTCAKSKDVVESSNSMDCSD